MTHEREVIDKIKSAKFCGYCCFYDKNGFCRHIITTDKYGDRDSEDSCNINQFKYNETKFSWNK